MNRSNKHKKTKRLWLKITLGIILILFIGIGTYAFSIYGNAEQTVNEKMHKKVNTIDTKMTKEKVTKQVPLNILLLGVDPRGSERGRSDAIMVLTLDPNNERMQLISIPRDTRTMIAGKGYEDKINHAFAFGGAEMSIATVEEMLGIDLDYYVDINMEGLADFVDAIGGITINNELEWTDVGHYQKGFVYKEGEITLDGPQTLGYVRMRKLDPAGDFGRTERTRKVIGGIIDKGASLASVNKINGIIGVLGNNMETNMDFDDMKNLLMNYSNARKNVNSYMLQGSGATIEGIYYYVVPQEELTKVNKMITEMNL